MENKEYIVNCKEYLLQLIDSHIKSMEGTVFSHHTPYALTHHQEHAKLIKRRLERVFDDIEIIKSEYSCMGVRSKAIENAFERLMSPNKNRNNF